MASAGLCYDGVFKHPSCIKYLPKKRKRPKRPTMSQPIKSKKVCRKPEPDPDVHPLADFTDVFIDDYNTVVKEMENMGRNICSEIKTNLPKILDRFKKNPIKNKKEFKKIIHEYCQTVIQDRSGKWKKELEKAKYEKRMRCMGMKDMSETYSRLPKIIDDFKMAIQKMKGESRMNNVRIEESEKDVAYLEKRIKEKEDRIFELREQIYRLKNPLEETEKTSNTEDPVKKDEEVPEKQYDCYALSHSPNTMKILDDFRSQLLESPPESNNAGVGDSGFVQDISKRPGESSMNLQGEEELEFACGRVLKSCSLNDYSKQSLADDPNLVNDNQGDKNVLLHGPSNIIEECTSTDDFVSVPQYVSSFECNQNQQGEMEIASNYCWLPETPVSFYDTGYLLNMDSYQTYSQNIIGLESSQNYTQGLETAPVSNEFSTEPQTPIFYSDFQKQLQSTPSSESCHLLKGVTNSSLINGCLLETSASIDIEEYSMDGEGSKILSQNMSSFETAQNAMPGEEYADGLENCAFEFSQDSNYMNCMESSSNENTTGLDTMNNYIQGDEDVINTGATLDTAVCSMGLLSEEFCCQNNILGNTDEAIDKNEFKNEDTVTSLPQMITNSGDTRNSTDLEQEEEEEEEKSLLKESPIKDMSENDVQDIVQCEEEVEEKSLLKESPTEDMRAKNLHRRLRCENMKSREKILLSSLPRRITRALALYNKIQGAKKKSVSSKNDIRPPLSMDYRPPRTRSMLNKIRDLANSKNQAEYETSTLNSRIGKKVDPKRGVHPVMYKKANIKTKAKGTPKSKVTKGKLSQMNTFGTRVVQDKEESRSRSEPMKPDIPDEQNFLKKLQLALQQKATRSDKDNIENQGVQRSDNEPNVLLSTAQRKLGKDKATVQIEKEIQEEREHKNQKVTRSLKAKLTEEENSNQLITTNAQQKKISNNATVNHETKGKQIKIITEFVAPSPESKKSQEGHVFEGLIQGEGQDAKTRSELVFENPTLNVCKEVLGKRNLLLVLEENTSRTWTIKKLQVKNTNDAGTGKVVQEMNAMKKDAKKTDRDTGEKVSCVPKDNTNKIEGTRAKNPCENSFETQKPSCLSQDFANNSFHQYRTGQTALKGDEQENDGGNIFQTPKSKTVCKDWAYKTFCSNWTEKHASKQHSSQIDRKDPSADALKTPNSTQSSQDWAYQSFRKYWSEKNAFNLNNSQGVPPESQDGVALAFKDMCIDNNQRKLRRSLFLSNQNQVGATQRTDTSDAFDLSGVKQSLQDYDVDQPGQARSFSSSARMDHLPTFGSENSIGSSVNNTLKLRSQSLSMIAQNFGSQHLIGVESASNQSTSRASQRLGSQSLSSWRDLKSEESTPGSENNVFLKPSSLCSIQRSYSNSQANIDNNSKKCSNVQNICSSKKVQRQESRDNFFAKLRNSDQTLCSVQNPSSQQRNCYQDVDSCSENTSTQSVFGSQQKFQSQISWNLNSFDSSQAAISYSQQSLTQSPSGSQQLFQPTETVPDSMKTCREGNIFSKKSSSQSALDTIDRVNRYNLRPRKVLQPAKFNISNGRKVTESAQLSRGKDRFSQNSSNFNSQKLDNFGKCRLAESYCETQKGNSDSKTMIPQSVSGFDESSHVTDRRTHDRSLRMNMHTQSSGEQSLRATEKHANEKQCISGKMRAKLLSKKSVPEHIIESVQSDKDEEHSFPESLSRSQNTIQTDDYTPRRLAFRSQSAREYKPGIFSKEPESKQPVRRSLFQDDLDYRRPQGPAVKIHDNPEALMLGETDPGERTQSDTTVDQSAKEAENRRKRALMFEAMYLLSDSSDSEDNVETEDFNFGNESVSEVVEEQTVSSADDFKTQDDIFSPETTSNDKEDSKELLRPNLTSSSYYGFKSYDDTADASDGSDTGSISSLLGRGTKDFPPSPILRRRSTPIRQYQSQRWKNRGCRNLLSPLIPDEKLFRHEEVDESGDKKRREQQLSKDFAFEDSDNSDETDEEVDMFLHKQKRPVPASKSLRFRSKSDFLGSPTRN